MVESGLLMHEGYGWVLREGMDTIVNNLTKGMQNNDL